MKHGQFIETPNTKKIDDLIHRRTTKPVEVRDIAEFANKPNLTYIANYMGTAKEYVDRIVVHLNFSGPESLREAVFVHELLHILLRYEGFPGVATRANSIYRLPPDLAPHLEKLRNFFSSTIDHLNVYRRMGTDFALELTAYFEEQVQAKTRRFTKFSYKDSPRDAEYYFHVQQDILDGLNYYEFSQPYSEKLLTLFKEICPEGFASCSALHGKLSKTGYSTPQQILKCANLVRDQIIKYGEKKSVGSRNLLWGAIHIVKDAKEIPLDDWGSTED